MGPEEAVEGVISRGSAGRGLRSKYPNLVLIPASNLVEPNWKPEDKAGQMKPALQASAQGSEWAERAGESSGGQSLSLGSII